MKKNILLITALLLGLAACNENSNSNVSNSSTNENSSNFVTPSVTDNFDESKYEAAEIVKIKEIYLVPGETYHLDKMINDNQEYTNLVYETSSSDVSVSNEGIITASPNVETDDKVTSTIYVHTETKLQKVSVNVVNYQEYGSYFTSVDIGRLYGKNVIFFGDSITHNWAKYPGGDRPATPEAQAQADKVTSLGYPGHYIVRLNDICHFASVTNAAWSGGTMAYLPKSLERFTYKSFPGAVNDNTEAIKKADVMFVFYGTNDLTDQVPLGTVADNCNYGSDESSTFCGGMNYGIEKIRELNPNAVLIFINILTRIYGMSNLAISLSEYNDAIQEVALAQLVRVIDVEHLFTPAEFVPPISTDGLHPQSEGYAVLTDYILNDGKK